MNCQVCKSLSSGVHFGVEVCSACSAFFRRSISKNQKYSCMFEGFCPIPSPEGNMCRRCRFRKCEAVGMNRYAVQKHRDLYGKRDRTASLVVYRSIGPTLPVLERVQMNYGQLENLRIVLHKEEGTSVFTKRVPRAINYKEAINVFLREYPYVEELISHSFSEYEALPIGQKSVLLRNFYLQFVLLEGGFFSCQKGRSDIRYLPSGDFIDCVHPETYYFDPEGRQPISPRDAARMFSSSFCTYRRNVTHPMLRDEVDRLEFLALVALAFFDPGLEGQSSECISTCHRIRESVQKEILHYHQTTKTELEAPIRLGNMLSILPNLQRAAFRFHEDMTLSNVMNAYSVDQNFYEKTIGTE